MEVLSEHCTEGWLEGYVLTGRHGVWSSYEAFAQVVDSMITQHAKWLEESKEFPWRRPIASLNVFLTSHAWRNDHNGFSHQAPGFVDNALQRRSEVIRIYYPPDANTLLSVMDHCLRSRNYVNIVTCGKQFALQWLDMDQAISHCSQGASIWKFASNDDGGEPDVVLACAGDVPTQETVAAAWLLRKHVPGVKLRVVNVVDLGVLMSPDVHPHGMDNISFEGLFTHAAPVIFAHHGYPAVIHSMMHGRANEARFHVRGFKDAGTTTTPFDMVVLNGISRFDLAKLALRYVPRLRVGNFGRDRHVRPETLRTSLVHSPEFRGLAGDHQLVLDAGFQRSSGASAACGRTAPSGSFHRFMIAISRGSNGNSLNGRCIGPLVESFGTKP
jgi:xylulose-5-phosphate/fructose-6-phosphate phosphoketolase